MCIRDSLEYDGLTKDEVRVPPNARAASPFVGCSRHFVEGHFVVSAGSRRAVSGEFMTSRSLLLTSAAMLFPLAPLAAQQQAVPEPAPTTASPTPAAQTPGEEFGDEEEIVITGAKPRGSVVG